MADRVEKCNVNSTPVLQNVFSVNAVKKEEFPEDNFVDDKVQISETAVTAEVQKNVIYDQVKQYDVPTGLDSIKTELSLPEAECNMIHNSLKIEDGINADDIKIEFNNGFMYCEDCQVYCEDYCANCGMLVHILNKTVQIDADTNSQEELPNHILEIRDYFGEHRIFALKVIPVAVKFGPFTGINTADGPCKIKGGKFIVSEDKSKYLNWMQHIKPARNISEQNLLIFQYKHNLYYQSTRHIQEGDELLVYFGDEHKDSLKRNVEVDFIPATEHNFKDAFACTICCFGFSSKSYLGKHKAICRGNNGEFSMEELVQCPSCKTHFDQKGYLMHHNETNDRKCSPPTSSSRTELVLKTRSLQMYKCQQCKYRTKYKGDLQSHTNQHYDVKVHKCEICYRRFKTKEVLKLHLENTHICADGKDDVKHTAEVYTQAQTKPDHSSSEDEMKRFKCSLCEFRTKYKANLITHMSGKHLKKLNYKCNVCEYKANRKSHLQMHIEARHLQVFNYKCDTCDYKSNHKSNLNRHIETKHRKVFKHKCDTCDYKTSWKTNLKSHTKSKHSNEFRYKCDTCDYKANQKHHLKLHIETKHLKEFKYKCDVCDYKTNQRTHLRSHMARHMNDFKYKCDMCDYKSNRKGNLKSHVESRHLNEFKYKCGTCPYKTNWKPMLKGHIETKHLKEFKYNCDTCDYKTSYKTNLNTHIETKHLTELKYKCDACDYKTSYKTNLKRHVETKHLKEFKYNCDTCDYKTSYKINLNTHMETRHLKEFKYKCETCDYKTNRKGNLKQHIETRHSSEFKYKCGTCCYKTNWKPMLKSHIETKHMKEFKYKCDRCAYETSQKANLKKHIKTKHLKEFKCGTCDYKANQKVHIETRHS